MDNGKTAQTLMYSRSKVMLCPTARREQTLYHAFSSVTLIRVVRTAAQVLVHQIPKLYNMLR